jgi:hypothetical protein
MASYDVASDVQRALGRGGGRRRRGEPRPVGQGGARTVGQDAREPRGRQLANRQQPAHARATAGHPRAPADHPRAPPVAHAVSEFFTRTLGGAHTPHWVGFIDYVGWDFNTS